MFRNVYQIWVGFCCVFLKGWEGLSIKPWSCVYFMHIRTVCTFISFGGLEMSLCEVLKIVF